MKMSVLFTMTAVVIAMLFVSGCGDDTSEIKDNLGEIQKTTEKGK